MSKNSGKRGESGRLRVPEGVAAAVAGAVRGATTASEAPVAPEAAAPRADDLSFTREELRRISADLASYFPLPVDESHLVLTEVDPHRVHVYWGLRAADVAAARTQSGAEEGSLVLRFREPSTPPDALGPRPPFYVEVGGLRSDTYVDLWGRGRSYVAELGLIGNDGSFAVLATSNEVELPWPGSDAPAGAEQASTPPVPEAAEVTDPTIAQARGPLEPVFPEAAAPTGPAIVPGIMPPPDTGAAEGEAGWMEPQPVLGDYPAAREILAQEHAGEPIERIGLPAWESGDTAAPASGGGEPWVSRVAYSSSLLGRSPGDEVEVHVDLYIHGRIRPGDSLRLFGEPVPVRPDGTFSYRRPLPEAVLVVPVEIGRADAAGEAPLEV